MEETNEDTHTHKHTPPRPCKFAIHLLYTKLPHQRIHDLLETRMQPPPACPPSSSSTALRQAALAMYLTECKAGECGSQGLFYYPSYAFHTPLFLSISCSPFSSLCLSSFLPYPRSFALFFIFFHSVHQFTLPPFPSFLPSILHLIFPSIFMLFFLLSFSFPPSLYPHSLLPCFPLSVLSFLHSV